VQIEFGRAAVVGRNARVMKNTMSRAVNYIWNKAGVKIEARRKRPKRCGDDDRVSYQERYVKFDIEPGQRVLDIGNGGYPFPYATVVADRFLEKSPSRYEQLATGNKPFVLADIHDLAFRDQAFDFVYCSHVVEVVENPLRACKEIMRVGKRGYIETPTLGKDALFAWAKNLQKWHVVGIGRNLCFFEYSERQLEGIRSSIWRDLIFSEWHNPLQEVFYNNQDLFNVMFTWVGEFSVFLFRLDGTVEALNAETAVRHGHRCSHPARD
jgi:SAM-dependent methyltransferase